MIGDSLSRGNCSDYAPRAAQVPAIRRVNSGRQRALEICLAQRVVATERAARARGETLSIEAVVTAIQAACGDQAIVLTQENWADAPGGAGAGGNA